MMETDSPVCMMAIGPILVLLRQAVGRGIALVWSAAVAASSSGASKGVILVRYVQCVMVGQIYFKMLYFLWSIFLLVMTPI